MRPSMIAGGMAAMLICVAAGAQTKEHAPVAMRSSGKLVQEKQRSESWTYVSPNFKSSRFSSVCVLPTAIYIGPDAQFPGTSAADKRKFAGILTAQVRNELGKNFTVYPQRRTGCLSLQMTLVGLEDTRGGVATATRVLPVGLALSAVKSLRGKKGTLTGSLLIAIEVTGTKNSELLVAAVRRRFPDALDIPATVSMSETVTSIGRDFGRELSDRLMASGVMSRP